MTFKAASAADLTADIRERSRQALQVRLLASAHSDVRSQLLEPVTRFVRGLNEAQIVVWHGLLDHQEVPHA